jgi:proliferating cell nuclear antigen
MYEQDKDILVWEDKVVEDDTLIVSVHKYKNGQPKVQISRQKDGNFAKLGRMTWEETMSILPLLKEAVGKMVDATSEAKKTIKSIQKEETKTEAIPMQDIKELKPDINEMKPDFKIMMTDPMDFKKQFAAIKDMLPEVELNIKRNSIEFTQMDPANVSMIIYTLPSSSCAEYNVREDMKIGIKLKEFYDVLKTITKEDVLEMSRLRDNLILKVIGNSASSASIPIIEIKQKEQKVPNLEFKASIKMNSKDFKEAVTKAAGKFESVQFNLEKGKLTLIGDQTTEVKEDGNTTFNGEARCKYSSEYLKSMMRMCSAFEDVIMEFATDYPLKMKFVKVDRCKVEYIIAPRVE